ncbi:hypothetical protein LLEC1_00617 [Akanthomyces lecanii]|uniref:Uncharacterized protein n=1 Tax=Cordyceps confragosa TaxID=2714763 RepID=A0A179IE46_CORDF|nr:hypothetical protein LLEC1_00617 [Akanthomyces lecanii]
MVRPSYLAAFLGIPTVIQAGLVTPRGDDADTTIRGTAITSMFETIIRHSSTSPNQSATRTADTKISTTSVDGGTSTKTSADQDVSLTKASTSSAKEESPATSTNTATSRTSAEHKSSASSAKSESSLISDQAETQEASAKTKAPLTSLSGEATSTLSEDSPSTSPSTTSVKKETTEASIPTKTQETSTGTATQTTSAAPTRQAANETAGAEALPPSRDPWYRAPVNFTASPHGAYLKQRVTPGNLTSMLKHLQLTHQIMYRYDDTWGKPTWAVTTVLSPKTNDVSAPNFVTYQAPYHSANIDGSPSYLLSIGSPDIEWHVLDRMLENGWHVSLPDYEGPNASYGAGKMAGHAVLDAMHAVHNAAPGLYGVDFQFMRHIAWGYSGGALATAWAFREGGSYLKTIIDDKRFNHFVIGGFSKDPIDMIKRLDGHEEAGMALHAISGLMSAFRHINGTIKLAAKTSGPFNVTVFDRVKTMSRAETKREFARQNLSDYFVNGLDHVVKELRGHQPREQRLDFPKGLKLDSLVIGRDRRTKKLLVFHGVYDELAPIEKVDEFVKKGNWCHSSIVIYYYRNHVGGHLENQHLALETTITWMKNRFRVMQFFAHEGGTMEPLNENDEHFEKMKCARFQLSLNSEK